MPKYDAMEQLLTQWVASAEMHDERAAVEEALGFALPEGIPVEGRCLDRDTAEVWHSVPLRLQTRETESGGMEFVLRTPALANQGDVLDLFFVGPRLDGSPGRTSLTMGDVDGREVRAMVTREELDDCPIDLRKAVPVYAEMLLHRNVEREIRLASATEEQGERPEDVVEVLIGWVGRGLGQLLPPLAPAPELALAAATERPVVDHPVNEVDDGTLVIHRKQIEEDLWSVGFTAHASDYEGFVISFSVNGTDDSGRAIRRAYGKLIPSPFTAGPTASFHLNRAELQGLADELDDEVDMLSANRTWEPCDVPALRWSAAHAATETQRDALQQILHSIEQEGE